MVDIARKRATYAEYVAFTETSELKYEYSEKLLLESISVELAVDDVYADALGAIVA